MGYLDNLAQSMIATTRAPRQETEGSKALSGAVSQFGKEFQKELEPFKMQKKADILTHEYAADPYRLDLTKKLAQVGGNQDWAVLAGEVEKARNAVLDFKKQKKVKAVTGAVAKQEGTTFNDLKNMKEKSKIRVGDWEIIKNKGKNSGWAYRNINAESKDFIGTKSGIGIQDLGILAKEPEKQKTADKQKYFTSLKELKHNVKVLERKFNSVVPGRSEIESLYKAYASSYRGGRGGGRGGGAKSKRYELKYKEFMKATKDLKTNIMKMGAVPPTTVNSIISFFRDMGSTMKDEEMENGLAFSFQNAVFKEMERLSASDNPINTILLENDIYIKHKKEEISKMKCTETEKIMKRYSLLMDMISPSRDIMGKLTQRAVQNSMKESSLYLGSFHGEDLAKFNRLYGDIGVLVKTYTKMSEEDLIKAENNKFNSYAKSLNIKKEGAWGWKGEIEMEDLQNRINKELKNWGKYEGTPLYKKLQNFATTGTF